MLPKELHQMKYEAIRVPQGSVRLVKKTQDRKSSTCYLLITKYVTSSSTVPLKTRRVWGRCTLNLLRAQMSSSWSGSKKRPAQVSSSSTMVQNYEVDSVAIEVSSRPKLTGIVRGKAFLHVLRRRPIGCPDSRKHTR
ncbi:hypothetical protein TNCV_551191 [Trichonephila clavipes]|nr:hypothetical protein TNCV_551191 [Trichonephila clavipes]